MENVNMETIQNVVKQNKNLKLVKTRIAAVMLAATTVLSAGTISASAASVTVDSVTVSQDGYVTEQDYTSGYLSDKEAKNVNSMIEKIDADYQKFYNLMANGVFANVDVDAAIARLIATNNEITNQYQLQAKNQNFGYSAKNVIDKYLETKKNESRALFVNVVNTSMSKINDYQKTYDCVFATNIQGGNAIHVAVYKKGNGYNERTVVFDDSKLSTNKALVVVPNMEVLTTTGGRMEFNTKYTAAIVENANVADIQKIMDEAEVLYDKLAAAINKGDYTKKYNETMEDVYIAFNGDLNLISTSLQSKYATYTKAMETVRSYMTYRVTELTVQVYKKNTSYAKYMDFVNYAGSHSPVRSYESDGYVYYNMGSNGLYRAKDDGSLKTADLSATGSNINTLPPVVSNNEIKADVAVGINIYYNGYRFYPKDAAGNDVQQFVYNGTTYSPVRAIAGLCGYNVEWDQTTKTVYLTKSGYNVDIQPSNDKTVTKSVTKTVEMYATKGIRVFVDGVELVPRDAKGDAVPIINWNGTTYLPVRALAERIGLEVTYDSKNNVVMLGKTYNYGEQQPSNPVVNEPTLNKPYLQGTKNGVQYKIYFDDNGYYLYVDGKFVPTNIADYELEEVKTR